ncbi:MAG: DNA repair protein RadC [Chloroflexi bacterium]|nr:DNA repair protein RadC [Chloroflexota bacterium]
MLERSNAQHRISEIAASERPRDRLAELGPQALSNAELLAILIRVGVQGENAIQVGLRILGQFGSLMGLHRASYDELCSIFGIGPAKAAQLKAAIELGRRLSLETPEELPTIHSPADAASLVMYEMSALRREQLRVMLLNTRNQVLEIKTLYQGSLNSSTVRVGEIFRQAIIKDAAAAIIVHNHPSGDPNPSPDDVALTRTLVEAGRLLDVEILDHLVIGNGRFVSLKEKRLGFN